MSIKRDIPQISALREQVEQRFGSRLSVHADFVAIVTTIEMELRTHISETTLERVWGYSTRGYDNISLHTLDVLSRYARGCDWVTFCQTLQCEAKCESNFFNLKHISTSELRTGDRIRIGWLPDRLCDIRYLGDNRFVALRCENSKMQPGDQFSVLQFTLGCELQLSSFKPCNATDNDIEQTYIVGQLHGLTTLCRLADNE